jgi:hypothetical protein
VPKKCGPAAGDGGPRNDLEEHTPSFRSDRRQSAIVAPAIPDAPAPGTETTRGADRLDGEIAAPPNVLSWRSAADRNRKLRAWRRTVSMAFGEQPRALRVAWALEQLFNTRTGYAYPSNTYLARETGIAVNRVQEALAVLEAGGAILRAVTVQPGRQRWRAIYPAATLLADWGSPPPAGVTGHPRRSGAQNLKRFPPLSQLVHARAASAARDQRAEPAEAAEAAGKVEE